jgi:hypothetical protein
MQKFIATLMIMALVTSCGGVLRTPDEIPAYEYGDSGKSCDTLKSDLDDCRSEITLIKERQRTKVGINIAMGTVGALLFWPLLFTMDFSDVDAEDLEAQRQRYEAISLICQEKGCNFEIAELDLKLNPEPVQKTER